MNLLQLSSNFLLLFILLSNSSGSNGRSYGSTASAIAAAQSSSKRPNNSLFIGVTNTIGAYLNCLKGTNVAVLVTITRYCDN